MSYEGFYDDVTAYVDQFHSMEYESVASLMGTFIQHASSNEIGYTLYVYTISLFTSDEKVFIFLTYLLIASLTSYASLVIDRRYYMVMVAVLFFGLGSFVGLESLHLWRTAIASLLFLIAISCYERNEKVSYCLMIGACSVHLISLFFVVLFFGCNIIKITKNKYLIAPVTLLFFFSFFYFIQNFGSYLNIFAGTNVLTTYFEGGKEGSFIQWIKMFLLLMIYYQLHKNKIDAKSSFLIAGISFVILSYIFFPGVAFSGRFYQAFIVFIALILFKIIISIKHKMLISVLLSFIFTLKFYTLNRTTFMQQAYDDFSNIFQGILPVLYK